MASSIDRESISFLLPTEGLKNFLVPFDSVTEGMDLDSKSDSCADLPEQDEARGKDDGPSQPASCTSSSGDDASSIKEGDGAVMPYSGCYPSSGKIQLLSDELEAISSYSGDSTHLTADSTHALSAALKPNCSSPSPPSLKLNALNSTKTKSTIHTKVSAPTSDSKHRVSTATTFENVNSSSRGQTLKLSNKVPQQGSTFHPAQGSTSRPAHITRGYYPMGKPSPFSSQANGGSSHQNGFRNFRSDGQSLVGNDRFKMREHFDKRKVSDSSGYGNCGPRFNCMKEGSSNTSSEKDHFSSIQREQYNSKDFVIKYEQAMFFVIKSFSEDDIHKSIKYNVWASTQLGNKKLDAAFHNAETRSNAKGSKCPVFLFFSVNGSGQFVGLAEMIGQVDFKKSMDFWQLDSRWDGFFPVKWHIIKDISNGHLRHIILENNDNKSVTNSRDTQEIRFSQGLEMLKIFKSYPVKTSMLDDYSFYEEQEKLKRSSHSFPHSKTNNIGSDQRHTVITGASGVRGPSARANRTFTNPKPVQSLVSLAKNLSLNNTSSPGKNTNEKGSIASIAG